MRNSSIQGSRYSNLKRSITPNKSQLGPQRRRSPVKRNLADEEFKSRHGINQNFEQKAEDFFINKNKAETDSIYNKKTYQTTNIDLTNFETGEMGDRDLIYENTAASKKVMTRIVIENPILSNLLFQMIIFYNFFYAFLHFLLLIFISIYKLWIFKTADFKEYIAIVLIILYPLLEVSSLFFAYRGNINETVR